MPLKPRSISKSLDNSVDDTVRRQLAQDIQADEGNSQSPDGADRANGADEDADEEPWTDGEWNKWVAMGCLDLDGITLPAGPTSAALEWRPLQHRPQSVLVAPSTDVSVGLRDPDDPRLWPDLFYKGMGVKEVMSGGNWMPHTEHFY